jgi:hypothetical protein
MGPVGVQHQECRCLASRVDFNSEIGEVIPGAPTSIFPVLESIAGAEAV